MKERDRPSGGERAMYSDLESTLGITSPAAELEADAQIYAAARRGLYQAGLVTVWEAQSQLATVVLITLVAFAPLVATLAVMVCWSLVATFAYYHARLRGLPDVFDTRWSRPPPHAGRWLRWFMNTTVSFVKAWLAGVQPYLYAKAVSGFLARPAVRLRTRIYRAAVLTAALILFGVTAAHHLLRQAGLPDRNVLPLCCVGSVLNVTYRVVLSAIIVGVLSKLGSPLLG
jgi:hypothetical protein